MSDPETAPTLPPVPATPAAAAAVAPTSSDSLDVEFSAPDLSADPLPLTQRKKT
jgi:hypothetical protein